MNQADVLKLGANKTNEEFSRNPNFQVNNIISTEIRQNFVPGNTFPNLLSRLMNTKIVRFRKKSRCACVTGCKKPFYEISTVLRIDDEHPENENEVPIFYVEEHIGCSCWIFCQPIGHKFEIFEANTKELFSICETRSSGEVIKECCQDDYIILPTIYNYLAGNPDNYSTVNQYDTRSYYRTFEYSQQSYYKIGEPYVEKEQTCSECCCECILSLPCCCCCRNNSNNDQTGCGCSCSCDCCKCESVIVDKRTYIDIFNMNNESVGKFAYYYDRIRSCCSDPEINTFYEIYFPPDANELLKLARIGQMIFIIHFKTSMFGILPGSSENLNLFFS